MKYSVVIPVYNGEKTLKACLLSLEKQTVNRNEYEIIVVDDGSTDRSGKLAKAGADHHFYQENQGPAAARNLGVQKACGDIILFTDSDCEPTENWIEEMIRPFHENPTIVGVKGAYLTKQKKIMARFVQSEYEGRYEFMKRWEYIDFIDTYAAAYKKSVFLQFNGFDLEFPIAMTEDTELSYRIAAAEHKMVFNHRAIVYHNHPTSFLYYLKRKYRAAYWRMLAVRKNREKVRGDSHTPNEIKYQILSMPVVFLGIIIKAAGGQTSVLFLGIALFLMSCYTFMRHAMMKDYLVFILSPFIIGARTIAYAIGLSLGVWRFFLKY